MERSSWIIAVGAALVIGAGTTTIWMIVASIVGSLRRRADSDVN